MWQIGVSLGAGRHSEGEDVTGALRWMGRCTVASLVLAELLIPTVALASHRILPNHRHISATLIQTVDMSLLDPPSPDSTGIAYKPGADQLLISDSEVDEMSIFQGVNIFTLTKTGTLTESNATTGFSDEPTGISYRRSDRMLFVSDDNRNEIYLVLPGPDGQHGTVDDVVDSFDTSAFGSTDPEGVAFDTSTGALFIIDGEGRKVYRVSPGANGIFDGVPPDGDDRVSNFDVGEFGATDPQGIAYDAAHDHLLVVDGSSDAVYELTKTGFLANTIDLTAANPVRAAGIVLAPGSNDPGVMNMYIVDRGVDNDFNPLENDGRLYEMSADLGLLPTPPVGLVDPTQGMWHLRNSVGVVTSFFYGNPIDIPFMGDWDCDGVDTPGLFRQSDAFAYLRNSNTQGIADIRFFFGNPSDIPLAGDFNNDGCDTLSLYRPSTQEFFIINELGENEGGLGAADFSFVFGNPGDKPVVGDWDGDGIDEVGLHRESTGLFYWRNTLDTGNADGTIFFGDPGDRFVAGDWGIVDGKDTPAVFRPSDTTFYFRHTLTQGNADSQFVFGQPGWLPVAGDFGLG